MEAGRASIVQLFAQTEQEPESHSCRHNIDRMMQAVPDYGAILEAGEPFEDQSFPHSLEAVYWEDRRPEKASHSLVEVAKQIKFWQRLGQRYPQNLMFGHGGLTIHDTSQS